MSKFEFDDSLPLRTNENSKNKNSPLVLIKTVFGITLTEEEYEECLKIGFIDLDSIDKHITAYRTAIAEHDANVKQNWFQQFMSSMQDRFKNYFSTDEGPLKDILSGVLPRPVFDMLYKKNSAPSTPQITSENLQTSNDIVNHYEKELENGENIDGAKRVVSEAISNWRKKQVGRKTEGYMNTLTTLMSPQYLESKFPNVYERFKDRNNDKTFNKFCIGTADQVEDTFSQLLDTTLFKYFSLANRGLAMSQIYQIVCDEPTRNICSRSMLPLDFNELGVIPRNLFMQLPQPKKNPAGLTMIVNDIEALERVENQLSNFPLADANAPNMFCFAADPQLTQTATMSEGSFAIPNYQSTVYIAKAIQDYVNKHGTHPTTLMGTNTPVNQVLVKKNPDGSTEVVVSGAEATIADLTKNILQVPSKPTEDEKTIPARPQQPPPPPQPPQQPPQQTPQKPPQQQSKPADKDDFSEFNVNEKDDDGVTISEMKDGVEVPQPAASSAPPNIGSNFVANTEGSSVKSDTPTAPSKEDYNAELLAKLAASTRVTDGIYNDQNNFNTVLHNEAINTHLNSKENAPSTDTNSDTQAPKKPASLFETISSFFGYPSKVEKKEEVVIPKTNEEVVQPKTDEEEIIMDTSSKPSNSKIDSVTGAQYFTESMMDTTPNGLNVHTDPVTGNKIIRTEDKKIGQEEPPKIIESELSKQVSNTQEKAKNEAKNSRVSNVEYTPEQRAPQYVTIPSINVEERADLIKKYSEKLKMMCEEASNKLANREPSTDELEVIHHLVTSCNGLQNYRAICNNPLMYKDCLAPEIILNLPVNPVGIDSVNVPVKSIDTTSAIDNEEAKKVIESIKQNSGQSTAASAYEPQVQQTTKIFNLASGLDLQDMLTSLINAQSQQTNSKLIIRNIPLAITNDLGINQLDVNTNYDVQFDPETREMQFITANKAFIADDENREQFLQGMRAITTGLLATSQTGFVTAVDFDGLYNNYKAEYSNPNKEAAKVMENNKKYEELIRQEKAKINNELAIQASKKKTFEDLDFMINPMYVNAFGLTFDKSNILQKSNFVYRVPEQFGQSVIPATSLQGIPVFENYKIQAVTFALADITQSRAIWTDVIVEELIQKNHIARCQNLLYNPKYQETMNVITQTQATIPQNQACDEIKKAILLTTTLNREYLNARMTLYSNNLKEHNVLFLNSDLIPDLVSSNFQAIRNFHLLLQQLKYFDPEKEESIELGMAIYDSLYSTISILMPQETFPFNHFPNNTSFKAILDAIYHLISTYIQENSRFSMQINDNIPVQETDLLMPINFVREAYEALNLENKLPSKITDQNRADFHALIQDNALKISQFFSEVYRDLKVISSMYTDQTMRAPFEELQKYYDEEKKTALNFSAAKAGDVIESIIRMINVNVQERGSRTFNTIENDLKEQADLYAEVAKSLYNEIQETNAQMIIAGELVEQVNTVCKQLLAEITTENSQDITDEALDTINFAFNEIKNTCNTYQAINKQTNQNNHVVLQEIETLQKQATALSGEYTKEQHAALKEEHKKFGEALSKLINSSNKLQKKQLLGTTKEMSLMSMDKTKLGNILYEVYGTEDKWKPYVHSFFNEAEKYLSLKDTRLKAFDETRNLQKKQQLNERLQKISLPNLDGFNEALKKALPTKRSKELKTSNASFVSSLTNPIAYVKAMNETLTQNEMILTSTLRTYKNMKREKFEIDESKRASAAHSAFVAANIAEDSSEKPQTRTYLDYLGNAFNLGKTKIPNRIELPKFTSSNTPLTVNKVADQLSNIKAQIDQHLQFGTKKENHHYEATTLGLKAIEALKFIDPRLFKNFEENIQQSKAFSWELIGYDKAANDQFSLTESNARPSTIPTLTEAPSKETITSLDYIQQLKEATSPAVSDSVSSLIESLLKLATQSPALAYALKTANAEEGASYKLKQMTKRINDKLIEKDYEELNQLFMKYNLINDVKANDLVSAFYDVSSNRKASWEVKKSLLDLTRVAFLDHLVTMSRQKAAFETKQFLSDNPSALAMEASIRFSRNHDNILKEQIGEFVVKINTITQRLADSQTIDYSISMTKTSDSLISDKSVLDALTPSQQATITDSARAIIGLDATKSENEKDLLKAQQTLKAAVVDFDEQEANINVGWISRILGWGSVAEKSALRAASDKLQPILQDIGNYNTVRMSQAPRPEIDHNQIDLEKLKNEYFPHQLRLHSQDAHLTPSLLSFDVAIKHLFTLIENIAYSPDKFDLSTENKAVIDAAVANIQDKNPHNENILRITAALTANNLFGNPSIERLLSIYRTQLYPMIQSLGDGKTRNFIKNQFVDIIVSMSIPQHPLSSSHTNTKLSEFLQYCLGVGALSTNSPIYTELTNVLYSNFLPSNEEGELQHQRQFSDTTGTYWAQQIAKTILEFTEDDLNVWNVNSQKEFDEYDQSHFTTKAEKAAKQFNNWLTDKANVPIKTARIQIKQELDKFNGHNLFEILINCVKIMTDLRTAISERYIAIYSDATNISHPEFLEESISNDPIYKKAVANQEQSFYLRAVAHNIDPSSGTLLDVAASAIYEQTVPFYLNTLSKDVLYNADMTSHEFFKGIKSLEEKQKNLEIVDARVKSFLLDGKALPDLRTHISNFKSLLQSNLQLLALCGNTKLANELKACREHLVDTQQIMREKYGMPENLLANFTIVPPYTNECEPTYVKLDDMQEQMLNDFLGTILKQTEDLRMRLFTIWHRIGEITDPESETYKEAHNNLGFLEENLYDEGMKKLRQNTKAELTNLSYKLWTEIPKRGRVFEIENSTSKNSRTTFDLTGDKLQTLWLAGFQGARNIATKYSQFSSNLMAYIGQTSNMLKHAYDFTTEVCKNVIISKNGNIVNLFGYQKYFAQQLTWLNILAQLSIQHTTDVELASFTNQFIAGPQSMLANPNAITTDSREFQLQVLNNRQKYSSFNTIVSSVTTLKLHTDLQFYINQLKAFRTVWPSYLAKINPSHNSQTVGQYQMTKIYTMLDTIANNAYKCLNGTPLKSTTKELLKDFNHFNSTAECHDAECLNEMITKTDILINALARIQNDIYLHYYVNNHARFHLVAPNISPNFQNETTIFAPKSFFFKNMDQYLTNTRETPSAYQEAMLQLRNMEFQAPIWKSIKKFVSGSKSYDLSDFQAPSDYGVWLTQQKLDELYMWNLYGTNILDDPMRYIDLMNEYSSSKSYQFRSPDGLFRNPKSIMVEFIDTFMPNALIQPLQAITTNWEDYDPSLFSILESSAWVKQQMIEAYPILKNVQDLEEYLNSKPTDQDLRSDLEVQLNQTLELKDRQYGLDLRTKIADLSNLSRQKRKYPEQYTPIYSRFDIPAEEKLRQQKRKQAFVDTLHEPTNDGTKKYIPASKIAETQQQHQKELEKAKEGAGVMTEDIKIRHKLPPGYDDGFTGGAVMRKKYSEKPWRSELRPATTEPLSAHIIKPHHYQKMKYNLSNPVNCAQCGCSTDKLRTAGNIPSDLTCDTCYKSNYNKLSDWQHNVSSTNQHHYLNANNERERDLLHQHNFNNFLNKPMSETWKEHKRIATSEPSKMFYNAKKLTSHYKRRAGIAIDHPAQLTDLAYMLMRHMHHPKDEQPIFRDNLRYALAKAQHHYKTSPHSHITQTKFNYHTRHIPALAAAFHHDKNLLNHFYIPTN